MLRRTAVLSILVLVGVPSSCGEGAVTRARSHAAAEKSSEQPSSARSAAAARLVGNLEDFLIQNVCAATSFPYRVIAADPFACPVGYRSRDLQRGEVLPYTKMDQPQPGRPFGFQTADSIPLSFSGGRRHIHLFDFGVDDDYLNSSNIGGHGAGGRDISARFEHNYVSGGGHRDGSDVSELGGPFASLTVTTDPSGTQPFWGPSCATEDGWISFPTDLRRGQLGRSAETLLSGGPTCALPQNAVRTITYFDYPHEPLGYTSGKVMESIVSWHFDAPSIMEAHHIEKFYFTREYGKTRWERWETVGRSTACDGRLCTVEDARGGTCSGRTIDVRENGPTFIRRDCRDWTNIAPHPQLGFDPYTAVGPVDYVDSNLLDNGDFGRGLGDMGGWRLVENSGHWQLLSEKSSHPLIHGNHYLIVSPHGRAPEASVYQDITLPKAHVGPGSVAYRTGFRLWSPDGASGAQRAALVIHAFDANGQVLKTDLVHVGAAIDYPGALIRKPYLTPPGTRRIRYQIYFACQATCGRSAIDSAYFTRE